MQVVERRSADVMILDLEGKLTLVHGERTLRDHVLGILDAGHRGILVNLHDVRAIDSSGLGELIACRATCTRFEAQLKLMQPSDKIRELMAVSKVLGLFEIFDDEQQALESF